MSKLSPYIVIEKEPERIKLIEEDGFPYVEGDTTNNENLISTGVAVAKCLTAPRALMQTTSISPSPRVNKSSHLYHKSGN